jgi:hypothetical protein
MRSGITITLFTHLKYGLKKGYRSILDDLRIFPRTHEPIRYIKSHRGVDIQIPDELIPLIENVLQRLDS